MSVTKTGVKAHDDTCNASEATRQVAVAAAANQAAARAAEIAHYRTCRASAIANNCSPAPFIQALLDMGTGGV